MRDELIVSEGLVHVLRRKQEIELHTRNYIFQSLGPDNLGFRERFSPRL